MPRLDLTYPPRRHAPSAGLFGNGGMQTYSRNTDTKTESASGSEVEALGKAALSARMATSCSTRVGRALLTSQGHCEIDHTTRNRMSIAMRAVRKLLERDQTGDIRMHCTSSHRVPCNCILRIATKVAYRLRAQLPVR